MVSMPGASISNCSLRLGELCMNALLDIRAGLMLAVPYFRR
ncbi:hypothetical protein [uncultured Corynebacterium sp.]|nr:hypothetical protein [uncultured Corynebacterium sp.]